VSDESEPTALKPIPRPRLIYAGALQNRVLLPVVREILESKHEWHFLHFGSVEGLPEGNAHRLPWMPIEELERVIAACDVGFMPYDLNDAVQYNVAPLKLLDYFGAGLPVVATPIADMKELQDLVYLGTTAGELTIALERALSESADNPKRARRKEIAQEHSLENIAVLLGKILPLEG
jgi:glycosyltransferase involved in cell wall biosynthesis